MAGEFLYTIGDVSQLEPGTGPFRGNSLRGRREPRIAMVGRSNVGKSSLINRLLGARLAQVSNQPGKTRAIHFYVWKEARKIIADLPGYGYAKVSAGERNRWAEFIREYFRQDPALERALVLWDARHGPTEVDLDAIEFLKRLEVPVTIAMTKSDTLKTQAQAAARRKEVAEALRKLGYDEKMAFWVSSRTKDGLKPLARFLEAG